MATELEDALGQLSLATLLAAAIVASGGVILIGEDDFTDPRLVGHQIGLTWDHDKEQIALSLQPITSEE